jgi:maleate isomerase
VMSCNLCLAWRAVEALERQPPRRSTLEAWLAGAGWVERLVARRTS